MAEIGATRQLSAMAEMIRSTVFERGRRVAVIDGDKTMTYIQFLEHIQRAAGALGTWAGGRGNASE